MPSCSATSSFEQPAAISFTTSRCRDVISGSPAGGVAQLVHQHLRVALGEAGALAAPLPPLVDRGLAERLQRPLERDAIGVVGPAAVAADLARMQQVVVRRGPLVEDVPLDLDR